MCMIKKISALILLLTLLSCDSDHPNLEGQTRVNFEFSGQSFRSTNEDSFSRVDQNDLLKDIYIYARDTVHDFTIDMKLTIDRNGLGTYSFQGSLEDSEAYIFVNDQFVNNSLLQFCAPHSNNLASGTVTITRNNGNRITGNFDVVTYDTENGVEQLRLENGTFDFWY